MGAKPKPPQVFAKFVTEAILGEAGRLVYIILSIFALNGYKIELFDNINVEALRKKKRYLALVDSIKNLTKVAKVPLDSKNWIYLFSTLR